MGQPDERPVDNEEENLNQPIKVEQATFINNNSFVQPCLYLLLIPLSWLAVLEGTHHLGEIEHCVEFPTYLCSN